MASIRFSSRAWMSSRCSAGVRSSSSRAAYLTIAISSLSPSASSSLLSFSLSAEEARSPPSTPFNPRCSTSTSILRRPTAADLASLTIPSLKCSFPALVHADYEAVKGPCDAWIEAVAAPPSATAARFLHDCLLPLFVCRLIPQAISQQRLVHAIKAIAWLMIADDDDDHPDLLGSDFATTSRRADLVMAILRGADEETSPFDCSFMASTKPSFASKSARMLKAFSELWLEICKEMSPSLRARFISSMADYFEGIKDELSTLEMEERAAMRHSTFCQNLLHKVEAGQLPVLLPVADVRVFEKDDIVNVPGFCTTCGERLFGYGAMGVYTLTCGHKYHPICFAHWLGNEAECVDCFCKGKLTDSAQCWILRSESGNLEAAQATPQSMQNAPQATPQSTQNAAQATPQSKQNASASSLPYSTPVNATNEVSEVECTTTQSDAKNRADDENQQKLPPTNDVDIEKVVLEGIGAVDSMMQEQDKLQSPESPIFLRDMLWISKKWKKNDDGRTI